MQQRSQDSSSSDATTPALVVDESVHRSGLVSATCLQRIMNAASRAGSDAFVLTVIQDRLTLRAPAKLRIKPLAVDFLGGECLQLARTLSRRDPLAKAVGAGKGTRSIVDATAGLGRDAFTLALLGLHVEAIERSAVLAALLRDGLRRAVAASNRRIAEAAQRIGVVCGDARAYLRDLEAAAAPDAVYLDPMYPEMTRAAQRRGSLRLLRTLVGDDPDAGELLQSARETTTRRVVVKRPIRAAALTPSPTMSITPTPTMSIKGKAVRYDVYMRLEV